MSPSQEQSKGGVGRRLLGATIVATAAATTPHAPVMPPVKDIGLEQKFAPGSPEDFEARLGPSVRAAHIQRASLALGTYTTLPGGHPERAEFLKQTEKALVEATNHPAYHRKVPDGNLVSQTHIDRLLAQTYGLLYKETGDRSYLDKGLVRANAGLSTDQKWDAELATAMSDRAFNLSQRAGLLEARAGTSRSGSAVDDLKAAAKDLKEAASLPDATQLGDPKRVTETRVWLALKLCACTGENIEPHAREALALLNSRFPLATTEETKAQPAWPLTARAIGYHYLERAVGRQSTSGKWDWTADSQHLLQKAADYAGPSPLRFEIRGGAGVRVEPGPADSSVDATAARLGLLVTLSTSGAADRPDDLPMIQKELATGVAADIKRLGLNETTVERLVAEIDQRVAPQSGGEKLRPLLVIAAADPAVKKALDDALRPER